MRALLLQSDFKAIEPITDVAIETVESIQNQEVMSEIIDLLNQIVINQEYLKNLLIYLFAFGFSVFILIILYKLFNYFI